MSPALVESNFLRLLALTPGWYVLTYGTARSLSIGASAASSANRIPNGGMRAYINPAIPGGSDLAIDAGKGSDRGSDVPSGQVVLTV